LIHALLLLIDLCDDCAELNTNSLVIIFCCVRMSIVFFVCEERTDALLVLLHLKLELSLVTRRVALGNDRAHLLCKLGRQRCRFAMQVVRAHVRPCFHAIHLANCVHASNSLFAANFSADLVELLTRGSLKIFNKLHVDRAQVRVLCGVRLTRGSVRRVKGCALALFGLTALLVGFCLVSFETATLRSTFGLHGFKHQLLVIAVAVAEDNLVLLNVSLLLVNVSVLLNACVLLVGNVFVVLMEKKT